jgi:hypothetical protein
MSHGNRGRRVVALGVVAMGVGVRGAFRDRINPSMGLPRAHLTARDGGNGAIAGANCSHVREALGTRPSRRHPHDGSERRTLLRRARGGRANIWPGLALRRRNVPIESARDRTAQVAGANLPGLRRHVALRSLSARQHAIGTLRTQHRPARALYRQRIIKTRSAFISGPSCAVPRQRIGRVCPVVTLRTNIHGAVLP